MVVPELDAATMLVCNTVLMKMTASFSFTSLQHQDVSFITAVTKLELLITPEQLWRLLALQVMKKYNNVEENVRIISIQYFGGDMEEFRCV